MNRAIVRIAVHDVVSAALDEAGIKNEVLRGMAHEVALGKLNEIMDTWYEPASKSEADL